jgi:hypothetical protein
MRDVPAPPGSSRLRAHDAWRVALSEGERSFARAHRGRRRPVAAGWLMRAAIAGCLVLRVLPAFSQDVTEPALKAAYIYNFAKFTEWPREALPAGAPLSMCVFGDDAVGAALERTVKGRTVAGHGIAVTQVTAASALKDCHVLYVSGLAARKAQPLVAPLRELPVLTISDLEEFIECGGIARFFFDRAQLRFRVHVEAARRARLQISSRLLELAK